MHDRGAAERFDEVSKICNRIGPATMFGCLRRIFQRAGLQRNLLDLLGEFDSSEGWLRNRTRAACLDHFFYIITLMIIRSAGQRHQDRRPSSAGQLGYR